MCAWYRPTVRTLVCSGCLEAAGLRPVNRATTNPVLGAVLPIAPGGPEDPQQALRERGPPQLLAYLPDMGVKAPIQDMVAAQIGIHAAMEDQARQGAPKDEPVETSKDSEDLVVVSLGEPGHGVPP